MKHLFTKKQRVKGALSNQKGSAIIEYCACLALAVFIIQICIHMYGVVFVTSGSNANFMAANVSVYDSERTGEITLDQCELDDLSACEQLINYDLP